MPKQIRKSDDARLLPLIQELFSTLGISKVLS